MMVDLTPELLAEKLMRASQGVHDEVLKGMKTACIGVVAESKSYMDIDSDKYYRPPHQTGTLQRSITYSVEENNDEIKGLVGTNVEYAPWVHNGTSKMEERPFLVDAINARRDDTEKILADAVQKGILKAIL